MLDSARNLRPTDVIFADGRFRLLTHVAHDPSSVHVVDVDGWSRTWRSDGTVYRLPPHPHPVTHAER